MGGARDVSGISYLSSDVDLCIECFFEASSWVTDAEVSDGASNVA